MSRLKSADWMQQIHWELDYSPISLVLSLFLFDSYCAFANSPQGDFSAIAIVSTVIAGFQHQVDPCDLNQFKHQHPVPYLANAMRVIVKSYFLTPLSLPFAQFHRETILAWNVIRQSNNSWWKYYFLFYFIYSKDHPSYLNVPAVMLATKLLSQRAHRLQKDPTHLESPALTKFFEGFVDYVFKN